MLGEKTREQRVRQGERAQEVLEEGLLQIISQELTGNYIEMLKNLEPSANLGRDHLISRLCVLGDVMEHIASEFAARAADGEIAVQEMIAKNG